MNRSNPINRISLIIFAVVLVTGAIIARLFFLQVISHSYYEEIAQAEQSGYTSLPARRGQILIEDYHSGEIYKLATNTTLNMIFADPTLIEDHDLIAETLAPLLFDLEIEQEIDEKRYNEEYEAIIEIESEILREESLEKLSLKNDEELSKNFQDNLADTLATKTRKVILISEDLDQETQDAIKALNLHGTELTENGNLYAFPPEISDTNHVASELATVFNTDSKDLERILLGKNRYVILKHRLEPETSTQIEEILLEDRKLDAPKFLGIRMSEEYFRFYPEQELGAQVLGYVNSAANGQYGIEGSFNEILTGEDGIFTSQIDAYGNQITVGDSVIEQAVDGSDVTLTIDRAIQLQVERTLASGVNEYRADSGQAIVINPETGEILAMAQYPTFNPNTYGDVFELVEVDIPDEEKEKLYVTGDEENPRYWLYIQVDPDVRIEIFPDEEDPDKYWAYKNDVGPEVYKNKMVQEVYEPGSIFKPLVMAAAIDANEVTANTTFVDNGPLEVDYNVYSEEYDNLIRTFDNQYHGIMTMTQVLEKSSNTGMSFVARQLGESLFYSYIKAFGFLERTEVGILDEVTGKVSHYDTWQAESEMLTKAFGQGISMTPLQLAQAYTALANDGIMMRPILVSKIEHADGSVEEFEPEAISRVIDTESSQMITAMMTATSESYYSLALENHYFAAKSGTAQTYKWGKALSGPGTTIAGFVSYGPIDNPQFLTVVKLDHPRTVEWGSATAGPISKEIINFLFDYYNLPPDKSN
ncbi:penicillin-binding protein 2 [Candidatus Peregrinibacteria bacterium]|jgi:cell division protein FtsI/penicillin-binding protein 2|nr:penicillin-binding protein 2 [Candidatus Peregrinibacteria bacterium]MBT4631702.1 penicillin-binding protein 2 [Candidatus Peregrinibacteria bacterium]MBT5516634.1 penicillin-binding protein 2 [Candidatus Peregrinibacteria bacterium]MBT5823982.1 penicillin-binding protein 2 [Candidatus Peregrinibacteria bacterium]